MRYGWGKWLGGTILAITAASFVPALLFANANAVPPLPWFFNVMYGTTALLCAVGAVVLLRRGRALLHPPPTAG